MPTKEQLRDRLLKKLKELFQLDQPDLDFGFYRIMHVKAKDVENFIDKDLLKIVEDAFGSADEARKAELQAGYEKAVQTAKDFGAPNPEDTDPVKKAKAALDALKDTVSAEADVYDHLYRFFERYYDDGDFISRRYYARETAGKAAPFSIPYNGEEVKLHWANADQYYIKTAEYFANYTFDLTQSAEVRKMSAEERILNQIPDGPVKVHFRIVDASEGEHGNVKASEGQKRFFIIHEDAPLEVSATGELVVNFEYRVDPDKGGTQEGTWRDKLNGEAVGAVLAQLTEIAKSETSLAQHLRLLQIAAPTDKDKNRPLLAKYINQYTARNSCDYFIHKDLGVFLHRELDFYIKNEVMRLDDIENADAPAVESYLSKIKVLRKIAGKLIDFLAQLENFQKKLWLKKKFVVETNYCITLDLVPEELYEEIAANEAQHDEWVKLFAINEIERDLTNPGYTKPLTVEFLKANNTLVLDTALFGKSFKEQLIGSIHNVDEQCDGQLIFANNFDALRLIEPVFEQSVDCACIDPPYNTGSDGFCYKDGLKSSTWITQQAQLIPKTRQLLVDDGSLFAFNDENEIRNYSLLFEKYFGNENFVETIIWNKRVPKNDKGIGNIHDFILLLSNNLGLRRQRKKSYTMRKDELEEIYELIRRSKEDGKPILETQLELKKFYRKQGYDRGITLYCELDPTFRVWGKINMSWPNARTTGPRYEVISPVNGKPVPIPDNGWRWKEDTFREAENNGQTYQLPDGSIMKGRIWYPAKETVQPSSITYLDEVEEFLLRSILSIKSDGSLALEKLGLGNLFSYPKSVLLIERLIHSIGSKNGRILDYFAGSGTTGHAVINLNREDNGKRKYILVEMGDHFDTVLKPRILKVVYSESWKDGKPTARSSGISHCCKYLRLESYEDTLNNLRFDESLTPRMNPGLREDFMLRYLLDVETRGSQSLLNIDAFADPTAYTLLIKKPGSDETTTKNVDLIETFNYLLGLRVNHRAASQTFCASFIRNPDPELPEDQHTKLVVDGGIKQVKNLPHPHPNLPLEGEGTKKVWWFRKIEGWLPKDRANPNNGQQEKTLIVWRNLTGDLEQDNLMLDEWFQKNRISTRDFEFDTIYVNGSNNLPNLKKDEENWKVRLIEEEFHSRMWEAGE